MTDIDLWPEVAEPGTVPAEEIAARKAANEEPIDPRPIIWGATTLRPVEQPLWLAKNRIPRNAVTILIGDEGIGKSLLWVWITAAITTGNPLLEFGIPARAPQKVLIAITEDHWSTTVRPRLEVAGADLDNVAVICESDDGTGSPIFPRDLHLIRESAEDYALIVIDAFLDTVAGGLTMKDPQQARLALHPWSEVAAKKSAAVMLLTHTNRVVSRNPRDKYGITGELRKKARMTLFAQQDEDGNLTVGPEKSNITRAQPAAMFTIRPMPFFTATEDHDGTVPLLAYIGDSDRTASDYIADDFDRQHGADPDDRTEAEQWLQDYLTENGTTASKTVKAQAKRDGISDRTIKRAAKSLGVVATDTDTFPRTTAWSLPSGASQATPDPVSLRSGPTGPTGPDLHKRTGPTAQSGRLGHTESSGPTAGPTAANCTVCRLPLAFDDGTGTHPTCEQES